MAHPSKLNPISLSCFDDKRFIHENGITEVTLTDIIKYKLKPTCETNLETNLEPTLKPTWYDSILEPTWKVQLGN